MQYVDDEADKGSCAAKELDLLAALVQVNKSQVDNFKLNLFDEAADDSSIYKNETLAASDKQRRQEMHFGTECRSEGYIKAVQNALKGVGFDDQPGTKSVGEDLLDLLDSVA